MLSCVDRVTYSKYCQITLLQRPAVVALDLYTWAITQMTGHVSTPENVLRFALHQQCTSPVGGAAVSTIIASNVYPFSTSNSKPFLVLHFMKFGKPELQSNSVIFTVKWPASNSILQGKRTAHFYI